MNNYTETAAPEREPSPDVSRPGLVRPVKRRIITGVASGLADYWNVSPVLTRLGFVLLAFAGGLGFFLYAAGWLLIPNDDGTESIAEEALRKARSGESHVGIVLIGLAALIGVSSIGGVDGGLAWAVALGVVGYLLYRGDFGRAGSNDQSPSRSDSPTSAYRSNRVSSVVSDQETAEGSGPPPLPPRNERPARPPRPPRTPRPPRERSILGRLSLAAGLITVGIMALFDNAGATVEFRHYIGAMLVVVSVGLLIGAFAGRARRLVLIGLLLLPVAAISQWVPNGDWLVSINDAESLVIDPTTVSDLQARYEYEAGDVTFDLRNLGSEAFDLEIDMKAGDLTVLLPDNTDNSNIDVTLGVGQVTVEVGDGPQPQLEVQVGIGEINTSGPDQGGLGLDYTLTGDSASNLTIDLGIGQVNLRN
ncbi:MAG: PspC domain-containing protein [Acidimicrobiia bacterium]|nr:PspC domain-containing protein [Acidimicrobiia bacterium]